MTQRNNAEHRQALQAEMKLLGTAHTKLCERACEIVRQIETIQNELTKTDNGL